MAHFYAKDVLEKCGGFEEESDHAECLASYLENEFDDKMLESIISTRKRVAKFQDDRLFVSGERSIQADIGEIMELIQQKNGIVPEEEKADFQDQV